MGTPLGYVLHTPCPEIYCLRLIDEYCENYAEILCVIVYCIGMCLRQNSGLCAVIKKFYYPDSDTVFKVNEDCSLTSKNKQNQKLMCNDKEVKLLSRL